MTDPYTKPTCASMREPFDLPSTEYQAPLLDLLLEVADHRPASPGRFDTRTFDRPPEQLFVEAPLVVAGQNGPLRQPRRARSPPGAGPQAG